MDIAGFFVLPDGRLRAGWRLLLFIILFVIALFVFSAAAAPFLSNRPILFQTVVLAGSAVFATGLMMRLFDHQPFLAVGLVLEPESWKEVRLGVLGGMGLVISIAAVEWSAGLVAFQPSHSDTGSSGVFLVSITGVLCVAAANEELLFRGYPFQRLVEGTNPIFAVALSSCLFGWLHATNPHATGLSISNTVLAGILLSLAYLKTRALWLPIGFHFSWNWTMAMVGLPVSGLEVFQMPWRVVPSAEHIWLHGGNYGPEGGLVATGALAIGIAYLSRKQAKTPRPSPMQDSPVSAGGSQQAAS